MNVKPSYMKRSKVMKMTFSGFTDLFIVVQIRKYQAVDLINLEENFPLLWDRVNAISLYFRFK